MGDPELQEGPVFQGVFGPSEFIVQGFDDLNFDVELLVQALI